MGGARVGGAVPVWLCTALHASCPHLEALNPGIQPTQSSILLPRGASFHPPEPGPLVPTGSYWFCQLLPHQKQKFPCETWGKLTDECSSLQFRVSTFPLSCVIIALTFPEGGGVIT